MNAKFSNFGWGWVFRISICLLAVGSAGGGGVAWAHSEEEEDEGNYAEPVVLLLDASYEGTVGTFSESFYTFKASGTFHLISVAGKPPVRWRLFTDDEFKGEPFHWCKPSAQDEANAACGADQLQAGRNYYLLVYSQSPEPSHYRIEIR